MFRRVLATLGLIGMLTACDDTTVADIGRRTFLNAPELAKEFGQQPVPVELHGLPWPGADPMEVIGTIRMPEGAARGLRFQRVDPDQGSIGSGRRLVLYFNAPAGHNRATDCRATEEMASGPMKSGRFNVSASYCKGTEWEIRAFMKTRAEPDDWLAYYQAMEELLGQMFPRE